MLLRILVLTILVAAVRGLATGAPESACDHMTPGHGVAEQETELPYALIVEPQFGNVAGDVINITIPGAIKGFLVEVRNSEGESAGTFTVNDPDNVKTINCHGGTENAATHTNPLAKQDVVLTWNSAEYPGVFQIWITAAQEFDVFWAHRTSEIIMLA